MVRGARNRSDRITRLPRALVFLVVVGFSLLTPVAAAASGGASEWSTPGGSSTWSGEASPQVSGPTSPITAIRSPPTVESSITDPDAIAPAVGVITDQPAGLAVIPGIVFPIAGVADYSASFGAPRPGGRTHKGVDIFAPKLTPVVAAASGTVTFLRNGIGIDCCLVRIRHDDGQSSLYLHLNNDTPGTDDGLGYGIAEGIEVGTRVEAGTVIGYVGDSGNAEETPSHLHFELHNSNDVAMDPYPYLQVAQGADPALFASATAAAPETLPNTGPTGGLLLLSVGLLVVGGLINRSRPVD